MKYFLIFIFLVLPFSSCKNKLTFEEQTFEKKSHLPCNLNCPSITVKIPVAKGIPLVADNINKKVFTVTKLFVDPSHSSVSHDSLVKIQLNTNINYDSLLNTYIDYCEKKKIEKGGNSDHTFGNRFKIRGNVKYQSDKIIDIQYNISITSKAGSWVYPPDFETMISLVFDAKTGKFISNEVLFKDIKAFTTFAEQKVRKKFKNLFRGEEEFRLPQTFLFTNNGLLLYYNRFEIDGRSEVAHELLLPYEEVETYLIAR